MKRLDVCCWNEYSPISQRCVVNIYACVWLWMNEWVAQNRDQKNDDWKQLKYTDFDHAQGCDLVKNYTNASHQWPYNGFFFKLSMFDCLFLLVKGHACVCVYLLDISLYLKVKIMHIYIIYVRRIYTHTQARIWIGVHITNEQMNLFSFITSVSTSSDIWRIVHVKKKKENCCLLIVVFFFSLFILLIWNIFRKCICAYNFSFWFWTDISSDTNQHNLNEQMNMCKVVPMLKRYLSVFMWVQKSQIA